MFRIGVFLSITLIAMTFAIFPRTQALAQTNECSASINGVPVDGNTIKVSKDSTMMVNAVAPKPQ